ncbi:CbrC family protein [Flavobacterium sp.]|uniref:CbrC family protein n=1 Tax=Flavobacterium sp. TaxID=239 RepID=UPI002629EB87|nr:CbrC family protein [Flavobacterium sp.]
MELPTFKYHPNAYTLEIISEDDIVCECCGAPSPYRYNGPFYTVDEIEDLCPWCIKNGKAAEKFGGDFQDPAAVDGVENESAIVEVSQRTPGFDAIQEANWLAHCDDLCAFVGYANPELVAPILDELMDDIEDSGFDVAEMVKGLKKEALDGYVFQCLHCGKHRIYFDD